MANEENNPFLEIRNIEKRFGSQTALEGMNLSIKKGEFFSLLGPSGCGKSTLLRILAGLESASSGEIVLNGNNISRLPARERPFNMVFQRYALFPHLSVFENVAFPLRIKQLPQKELSDRVAEALELVNLGGFGKRLPETLSGGQAQRVALARALANRPECLLLDEPLSALDQKLRERVQMELKLLQRRLGLTFIFVTHDHEEAMLLSDRIALMNRGRVEQIAAPAEMYEAPASVFCARFIGRRNEFSVESHSRSGDWLDAVLPGGTRIRARAPQIEASGAARLFLRPESARLLSESKNLEGLNVIQAEVAEIGFLGSRLEVVLKFGDGCWLRVHASRDHQNLRVGDRAQVAFSPEETQAFFDEGRQ